MLFERIVKREIVIFALIEGSSEQHTFEHSLTEIWWKADLL